VARRNGDRPTTGRSEHASGHVEDAHAGRGDRQRADRGKHAEAGEQAEAREQAGRKQGDVHPRTFGTMWAPRSPV